MPNFSQENKCTLNDLRGKKKNQCQCCRPWDKKFFSMTEWIDLWEKQDKTQTGIGENTTFVAEAMGVNQQCLTTRSCSLSKGSYCKCLSDRNNACFNFLNKRRNVKPWCLAQSWSSSLVHVHAEPK